MPLKPPRLHPGDVLGIVAPASAPPQPEAIDRSIAAVEALGFKPWLARHARRRHGFLAGTDRERAADLMEAFTRPRVRGILCVRGGYGTARLLDRLDYKVIREQAKVFVGYSDITSLHCAFLRHAGLVSFHGPMLNSDFIKPDLPAFTRNSFLRTLTDDSAPGSIRRGFRGRPICLRGGRATGQLVGGNLSILCASLGTPWQPPFRGRVLFLEDLDEVPYRLDRLLTHLLNAGALREVAGVAIGINQNCEDPKARSAGEYRQTQADVFRERLLQLKVPVVLNLPFGHVPRNATLPVGVRATLDADRADLIIEEPAVV